jgi:UDP-N-acetylglucosamine 2-epimerase (non-hydrolysing)
VEQGTNILAGTSKDGILKAYNDSRSRIPSTDLKPKPPMWDGKSAMRIWDILLEKKK